MVKYKQFVEYGKDISIDCHVARGCIIVILAWNKDAAACNFSQGHGCITV
jgi:hypothetical protein